MYLSSAFFPTHVLFHYSRSHQHEHRNGRNSSNNSTEGQKENKSGKAGKLSVRLRLGKQSAEGCGVGLDMSRALERLLPTLVKHLVGEVVENDDWEADTTTYEGAEVKAEVEAEEKLLTAQREHENDGNGVCSTKASLNATSFSNKGSSACSSAQRWRRCIEIWRHLLGSDQLFLALLFHSGSLWAKEWSPGKQGGEILETPGPTAGAGTNSSWVEAVLWFLQLHEIPAATDSEEGGDDNKTSFVHSDEKVTEKAELGNVCGAPSAFHIRSKERTQVQRAATGLLGDWFATVDKCGKRFARAYYFSCAIKIVALVGNATLIESIPHLHNLVQMDPRFSSHLKAFCSILCCLLVEEAQQQQPYQLRLPPPFFLLNFNLIGRGSRVGVWLPRALTGYRGAGKSTQEGDFYSCVVSCSGVVLRMPSSPPTSQGAGDIVLVVRLLDEAHMGSNDVLPLLPRTSGSSQGDERLQEKWVGRARRHAVHGSLHAGGTSPLRYWSAMCAATCSFVRIDVAESRRIVELLPPTTTAAANNNNRRAPIHQQEQQQGPTLFTVPLQRGSRASVGRDPLAAITFTLSTTARRLIGCRGLFTKQQSVHERKSNGHLSRVEKSNTNAHYPVSRFTTDAASCGDTLGAPCSAFFSRSEEELECLIECALHLQLEALLLCSTLPRDIFPVVDAWAVEATSNAIDLALATPWPVVRCLRASGFALCLMPEHQQHQSLLVAIGLFATLVQRQKERKSDRSAATGAAPYDGAANASSGAGWWEVFKVCVLGDTVIPGQFCSGFWKLVERAERSFRTSPSVRLVKKQGQSVDVDSSGVEASESPPTHGLERGPPRRLSLRRSKQQRGENVGQGDGEGEEKKICKVETMGSHRELTPFATLRFVPPRTVEVFDNYPPYFAFSLHRK
ncbi:hypothetical protein, conserved [Trypanosoma brucei gambiense DAL972]|uniref:Uncharacterized protein n=1 Tax=Trypanosoma brucei gambiense (strain MHOM/CI/86/DAL972) TaxID=679716 RepID=C9ZQB9_TRYB9|nr:hypothetical protein, conserved [Trypanosoma brucei gambiense DAL972]CBH11599.1 hypothetical protein, conserved [Trypanosoma brucei gambiense DAL972]|eukprot:XP_011773884.1 hypothetical protein, conserved [Trypanosoma brucei gambiense DAL972]